MLHHFTHQAADGRWHCVYRTPGCTSLTSVLDAAAERPCIAEAARLNRLQAQQHAASLALSVAPADRPIPKGFYTENDAA